MVTYAMAQSTPEYIEFPNSSAFISFKRVNSNQGETAFVENGVMIILEGDHRKSVQALLNRGLDGVKAWFLSMEKEWGSGWSHNSTLENWLLCKEKEGIKLE